MADEDEQPETDDLDDALEDGSKKGGMKKILLILVPLLLIGGGGGAAYYLGYLDSLLGVEKASGEEHDGEEGEHGDDDHEGEDDHAEGDDDHGKTVSYTHLTLPTNREV